MERFMKYFFGFLALVFAVGMTHAQWANQDVPAFHKAPPAKGEKLPPIMTDQQLESYGLTMPAQKESYKAAAKHSSVVYQLPCYCYCDRNHGHSSLRSCFEGILIKCQLRAGRPVRYATASFAASLSRLTFKIPSR